MKKRILSVLLAAAMVGTMLVGCGSSSSSKSSDDAKTESSDEKKVIKLGVRDNADQVDAVMDAIEAAGYKVDVTVFDDSISQMLHLEKVVLILTGISMSHF